MPNWRNGAGRTRITVLTHLSAKLAWGLRRGLTLLVGLPLLFLVTMLGGAVAGAAGTAVTLALGDLYSPSVAWNLSVSLLAASWAGLYGAVPPARFVQRLFPLRADERRRWGVMAMVVLIGVSNAAFAVWRQLHPDPLMPGTIGGPESLVSGFAVVIVQLVVMLHVYLRRESLLPGHRILYLRRFRSFSDRVVYRFLLAALPRGARLTVMVPAHGGARDFDPFSIGFAGLRWRDPLMAIPRMLVSPQDAWQAHVRRLVQTAGTVVVDGSADSASMAIEYGLIESLGAGSRTIVLMEASAVGRPPTFSGATTLTYQRDVRSSLWRGLMWLLLFVGYAYLTVREPAYYPGVGLYCFLLVLPAIFQKSIARESVLSLQREIKRRVDEFAQRPPRIWRGVVASILIGAVPLVAAFGARWYYPPLSVGDAAAWESATGRMSGQKIVVGSQTIDVPVPSGFVNPKNIITAFRRQSAPEEAAGIRRIDSFVPADYLPRALLDDQASRDVYMVVSIFRAAEGELLDVATFESQQDGARQPRQDELPANFAHPLLLGSGPRFISRAIDFSFDIERSAGRVHRVKTCTNNSVLVLGKSLQMTLCRNLETERDAQWTRAVTSQWIYEILQRNAAVPKSSTGMVGDIVPSAGASQSEAKDSINIRVSEVLRGSPAAAADLRAGDLIVAIAGRPMREMYELKHVFEQLPPGASVELTVQRDGRGIVLTLSRS